VTSDSADNDVQWEEYWGVGPADEAEVSRTEDQLGVRLPRDFRATLLAHQGMAPVPSLIEVFPGRPLVDFGPLLHCREGEPGCITQEMKLLGRGGYPRRLIIISTSTGGQSHFALHYADADSAPSVVFVRPELGYDNPKCIVHVALTWAELLSRLADE